MVGVIGEKRVVNNVKNESDYAQKLFKYFVKKGRPTGRRPELVGAERHYSYIQRLLYINML